MIHYLETEFSNLRYSDCGEGEVLILLHGYLEAIETFDSFVTDLSVSSRVICVDLPGHGKSTIKNSCIGIAEMAAAVFALIEDLKLNKIHLMGHSMGGYVALAFAERYPEKLASFTLLHSSANSDTDEKRRNRAKEIEFLKRGKKDLICSMAVPNTFSKKNQESFSDEMDTLIKIASDTKEQGIIAALKAMMNRPDMNEMLKGLSVPKYSFIGMEDNFIPFEKGMEWVRDSGMDAILFEHSGHMSFIEEKQKCVEAVLEILKKA